MYNIYKQVLATITHIFWYLNRNKIQNFDKQVEMNNI